MTGPPEHREGTRLSLTKRIALRCLPAPGSQRPGSILLTAFLLLLAVCLLALRLGHILADFPTYHLYDQGRARFTDEGFYTGAALHHFTLGRAYLPGGWNPAVFMPVWPLLVGVLFHFTGVSAVAARSLAVAFTGLGVLLAYAVARQYRGRLFAAAATFLVAANALGFFYGRLALLEPAQVAFLLLSIYLAGKVRPGNYALAAIVGIVFVAAVLTKTSTLFLLPAVLYPIWARNRTSGAKACWKLLAVTVGSVLLLLGAAKFIWFFHFQSDSSVILHLRPLWQLEHSPLRLLRFFFRGTWVDPVLFPLAVAGFVASVTRLRSLWRDTLFTTAFLWEAGYAAFIVYHYDGPPRYFVTIIVPTIWLALLFTEWLVRRHRNLGIAVAFCILLSVAWNIARIGNYLLHPRYTLLDASLKIRQTIAAQKKIDPESNVLLIGRGAEEISLLSGGLPAMDSDGAMPLGTKLDVYHPSWFMTWTSDPPLRAEIVAKNRRMVERAKFPNLDPYRHAGIVLYQLLPLTPPHDGRAHGTGSAMLVYNTHPSTKPSY